jgi:hypothetical protein
MNGTQLSMGYRKWMLYHLFNLSDRKILVLLWKLLYTDQLQNRLETSTFKLTDLWVMSEEYRSMVSTGMLMMA